MFTTIVLAAAAALAGAGAVWLYAHRDRRALVGATDLELEQLRAKIAAHERLERASDAALHGARQAVRELKAELEAERASNAAAARRLAELELERLEAAGDSLERSLGLEVAVHTPRPDDQSWSGVLHRVTRTHLELAGAVHSESGPAAGLVLIPRTPAPAVQVLGPARGAVEVPAEVG